MSMTIAEISEPLVEAGTSEEKAKAAAGVMPVIDSLARKTDVQELWSDLKTDVFNTPSAIDHVDDIAAFGNNCVDSGIS